MRHGARVRGFAGLGVGAPLGAQGCEAVGNTAVIVPDAGEAADVPIDLGPGEDTLDVPVAPLDRPDVPAATGVPAAMDAVDLRDWPPDVGPAACRSSSDCVGDPRGGVCDLLTGRCVECFPTADTCPAARHCDPVSLACVDGCRSASDGGSANIRCDTVAHQCVACVEDVDCAVGRVCAGGAAVGFTGRAGSRLDQRGVRCMRLELFEDRGVQPCRYTVRAAGAVSSPGARGGGGGTPFTAGCEAGSFVSSIRGRSGSRVDQLAFGCGFWRVAGAPTTRWRLDHVATAARGTWGGGGGSVFAYECPDVPSGQHTAVTTLSRRSGSALDAIGVRCGLPDIVVR